MGGSEGRRMGMLVEQESQWSETGKEGIPPTEGRVGSVLPLNGWMSLAAHLSPQPAPFQTDLTPLPSFVSGFSLSFMRTSEPTVQLESVSSTTNTSHCIWRSQNHGRAGQLGGKKPLSGAGWVCAEG